MTNFEFIVYLLYCNKLRKFQTGVTEDLDDLLENLFALDEEWSLVHYEIFRSKSKAQKRSSEIDILPTREKIELFILSKI